MFVAVVTNVIALKEMGASFQVGDIPEDLQDLAAEWREKLLEQVVELDDDVMEKYLDVRLLLLQNLYYPQIVMVYSAVPHCNVAAFLGKIVLLL